MDPGRYGATRRRLLLGAAALSAALVPGCGSGEPSIFASAPPDASTHAVDAGPDVPMLHLGTDSSPPSCNTGAAGGVCGCLDLPLMTDPPNLYLVLDHSGSMNEDNKWLTVRQSIASLMIELGPRARFGAALFPNPAGVDSCATGVEVAPLRRGDSPSGVEGPTTHALLSAIAVSAFGGTPTAATLHALAPRLASFSGRTYAILATDGGPNCDSAIAACPASQCTVNLDDNVSGCTPGGTDCCTPDSYGTLSCLDTGPTVDAITTLASHGVPTYVIGVPGSAPYASVLDRMAIAGHTARPTAPYYYPVDSTDQKAFYTTLSSIAAKLTATCSLPLGTMPPDPSLINVYFSGHAVPQAGPNGWTYSKGTVTLLGSSCQEVLDGKVLDLRVVAGCPTVEK